MRGRGDLLKAMAAGALAGVIAAAVSRRFQHAWNAAQTRVTGEPAEEDADHGAPPTVRVADALFETVAGTPVPDPRRRQASDLVHFATGAALGAVYGLLAELWPAVTAGYGTAYGTVTNLLLNEGLVPILGLAPSPARTPALKHLYAAASHLVFGLTMEGGRRLIERRR